MSEVGRLERQIRFLLEADRLKTVMRRTRLIEPEGEESRFENSAEHSWHIALMAMVLAEHSNEAVDSWRVVRMLLVHDLVEIDAGDTPAFGEQLDKQEREEAAAARIFGLLPEDQREEFYELWREFEARETAEARFANAVDRLLPPFQNLANLGGSWRDFQVSRERADARLSPIGEGAERLWEVVRGVLDEGERRGLLRG
ncbi:MAG: HD domain-containing protein [Bryobacter sp.]|nr:HD domain-containing protein [Bryobacter sp. CoA8 C33]